MFLFINILYYYAIDNKVIEHNFSVTIHIYSCGTPESF